MLTGVDAPDYKAKPGASWSNCKRFFARALRSAVRGNVQGWIHALDFKQHVLQTDMLPNKNGVRSVC
eukprot:8171553-Karenia_brevis.AAC.1